MNKLNHVETLNDKTFKTNQIFKIFTTTGPNFTRF